MTLFKDKLFIVLLTLLGLTLLSWCILNFTDLSVKWAGMLVLLIAFVKVRLIVIHYMEANKAALPIRMAFEAWLWGTTIAVLWLYGG